MAAEVNHYSDFSEYLEAEDDIAPGGDEPIEDDSSDDFNDSTNYTPSFHAQQAQNSMQLLKKVVSEPGWKKITKHKSGLNIWSKPGIDKKDKVPVLKGEYIVRGFTPQAVFAVISMRKLWDEWYEEGNLIENLNETTSLTYMVMKGLAGSQTRDLSLVEKIECTPTGVVYFVSTSVSTPKVPRVANRIRAQLKLNGWILDPVTANPPTTKITYVLQTNVKGLVPSFAAKKYLSRRPLVILNIDNYLQKNGPPPMVVNTTTTSPRRTSQMINSEPNHANRQSSSVIYGNEPNAQKRVTIMSISEEQYNEPPFGIEEDDIDELEPQSPIQSEISPTSDEFPIVIKTGTIRKVNRQQPMLQRKSTLKKSTSQRSLKSQSQISFLEPQSQVSFVEPQSQISFLEPQSAKIEEQFPIEDQSSIEEQPSIEEESSSEEEPPIGEEPPIVQHRHKDNVLKAFSQLRSYAKSLDGWNFFSENKGVKIYMKDIPGQSMPIMRGEAVISGGWTAEEILQTILNLSCRGVWDDRFEDGQIIERFTQDDILLRTSIKGTFPISARDFCTFASTERDSDTGVLWNVGISVIDPLIPEGRKHVRGDLHLAGWILRPRFDDSGRTISVHVTYIVDIDIKLDSIPSSILKAISTSTPLCIAKIDEYLQKNGCPPFLRKATGTVVSTEFNTKTSQYDLKIADISGGKVELYVSKKTYSTGFDISVQPEGVKTGLLPENNEVIQFIIPDQEDDNLKTLSVKLTKQTFRGFKMTLNGKYDIPIAVQEQNVKPSSRNQRVRSMIASLESNPEASKYKTTRSMITFADSKPEASKYKTTRSMITFADSKPEASNHKTTRPMIVPLTFADPKSEASNHKMTEEQTSPKQKAPISTTTIPMTATTTATATATATTTMATTMATATTTATTTTSTTTTMATKTTTEDSFSTSPYVIERQEPPVADVDHEQSGSAKSDLIVLGETLRFNSQQAGLMFASMLLAYYAGKLSGDH